jgi:tRNA-dihydrouridine synthase B
MSANLPLTTGPSTGGTPTNEARSADRRQPGPAPLHIGGLDIDPPLILAPMAGVTDLPYRRLISDFGAGLVTTEMISVEGLIRNHSKTWQLLETDPQMKAIQAVQLFGSRPERMAEAARAVEAAGAPVIDINAGCPVKKVARQGAGASLLNDPDLLAGLVDAVRRSVSIPVTVKIRLGWDSLSINAVEIARRLEGAGADAITLHARTAVQFYRGTADWSWIEAVHKAVRIPVIGNGDVTTVKDASRMFQETGCDGIMIGRGSLGNPWLFSAIINDWKCRPRQPEAPTWHDFMMTVRGHLNAFGSRRAVPPGHYRKILLWYSKGFPGSAQLRGELMSLRESREMLDHFQRWVEHLEQAGMMFVSAKMAADHSVNEKRTADEGHCC